MYAFLLSLFASLCLTPGVLALACWWPCCGETCEIGSDDFSGTLSQWTASGLGWSVSGGKATVSTSNSRLIFNTTFPSYQARMEVKVAATGDGDCIRLIGSYTDSNNYVFSELKVGSTPYLRLYTRISGSDTLLAEAPVATWSTSTEYTLVLCITEGSLGGEVIVSGNGVSAGGPLNVTPALKAGLATGTRSGTVTFDDVLITRTDDEDCPQCDENPCGSPYECETCVALRFPWRVQVDVAGVTNGSCSDCNDLNATYIFDGADLTTPTASLCVIEMPISGVCPNAACELGASELDTAYFSVGEDIFGDPFQIFRFISSASTPSFVPWAMNWRNGTGAANPGTRNCCSASLLPIDHSADAGCNTLPSGSTAAPCIGSTATVTWTALPA